MTQPDIDPSPELKDYIAVLRRRAGLIVAVALVVTGLVGAYLFRQPAIYQATASVLVRPITADPLDSLGPTDRLVDLSTERQIALSLGVAEQAREALGSDESADELSEQLEIAVPGDDRVLQFAFHAPTAEQATAGAAAFAGSYLNYRGDRATTAVAATTSGLEDRLAALNVELVQTGETIARLEEADGDQVNSSSEYTDAQNRRSIISGQIALLANDLAQRSSVSANPGEIISPPELPMRPASPDVPRGLVLALLVGTILGVIVAFIRDRLDPRVQTPSDVEKQLDTRVLSLVPASRNWRGKPSRPSIAAPGSRGAVAYQRAALIVGRQRTSQAMNRSGRPTVVLVTPVETSGSRSATAANLAMALSERHRVLLIDTDPRLPNAKELLWAPPSSSLSSYAQGKVDAVDTVSISPYAPSLSVVSGADEPSAPLAGSVIERLMGDLDDEFDIVVIDAPPLLANAKVLGAADLVDVLVVGVQVGRALSRSLLDLRFMLQQLHLLSLGAIVETPGRIASASRSREMNPPDDILQQPLSAQDLADFEPGDSRGARRRAAAESTPAELDNPVMRQ